MAALPLTYYGDDLLRTIAEPVKKVSNDIRKLIALMFETCAAEKGIGLAAPQVGVNKQIIVLDLSCYDIEPFCLINPVIKRRFGAIETASEGCLSLPGLFMEVARHQSVVVAGRDSKGRFNLLEASDLLARAIQHEVDHLTGRLFIDLVEDKIQLANELAHLESKLAEIRLTQAKELQQGGVITATNPTVAGVL
ncbi:MAG: peptide deformylase [Cyanobacteria bacterium NC_groundwater_1444_Ag_S-0.65um_54_12]|nr:peptide deformylase [Cyanobacteria bacterium NC_groundwater_1444_Ag_S-0.65um_54_12]